MNFRVMFCINMLQNVMENAEKQFTNSFSESKVITNNLLVFANSMVKIDALLLLYTRLHIHRDNERTVRGYTHKLWSHRL